MKGGSTERIFPPVRLHQEDKLPPPPAPPKDSQRIAKLLARAGIASRREIERMIAEGRIAIGGKVVETPATLLTSLHGVTVDGKPVQAPAPRASSATKPPAFDHGAGPQGPADIYDGFPRAAAGHAGGAARFNTEGLLLLTTDGELKRQLELPSSGVERTYRARVFGEISQERLEDLIQGVEIEGIRYGSIDANLERRTGRNAWIELRLTEGKNREVRRVLEHLGLQVSRLLRTSYGPFPLADLPSGAVDEVRQHDLVAFRKGLKGTKSSPAFAGEGDRDAKRRGGGALRPPRKEPLHAVPEVPPRQKPGRN